MKFSKHAWLIWGIALAVTLALIFLVLPVSTTAVWWIAAIADLLMFALCAYVFCVAFGKNDTLESKLFGWPIFKVGITALLVQIAAGIVLILTAKICPTWLAAFAEIIIFAAAGISLTVKDVSRSAVIESEEKAAETTTGWKAIRAKANALAAASGNPELKKLAEEIRFADPTPTSIDYKIEDMLETLSGYADAENIRKAFGLLEQRKAIGKEEKR